ncbi:hypothetical protein BEL04_00165 [Mucilaginibacter sp. PPCGB 2223]|uniref:hypothetical protein n=1 Tax=Mucilaginibacter sp. PPCGB 2223 TaxID=1886027 RepID=UPI000826B4B3|nr:hypothetical protein [Mucilaginibacter sp. PPCGB 2223]OCX52788.1 hypothetical protein BEL04_00165 [Mucilaginibacter sp. PPCGB 2223]
MKIRKATFHDAPDIKILLDNLGYKVSLSRLITQITTSFNDDDNQVWVCEDRDTLTGFAVLHDLPKLGSETGLLVVSCLSCTEQTAKNALERHVNELAVKRNCERITL